MNEDRTSAMPGDDLDARLSGYLRWQSDQLRGVPTAQEAATRIAGGLVRPRPRVRPALAWAALALAVLLAGLAVFYAGEWNPSLVVAPSQSARTSSEPQASPATPSPPAAPTPRPSLGPGPCGTGRVEIEAATTGELPADAEAIEVPEGGLIAMALENDQGDGGTIVIAGPGPSLRVVATFSGEEMGGDGYVQVLSWSPSGDDLLVWAGSDGPASDCGNLFVVPTDGRPTRRLSDNGPGDVASLSAFAPNGATVAYTEDNVLVVVSPDGTDRRIAFGACPNGPSAMHWAPDGTRVLLVCYVAAVVVDVVAGTDKRHWIPPVGMLDARWAADGRSIVAAIGDSVPGLAGGPLTILDIDPDGTMRTRVKSDVSTEWVLGQPLLSPDGRWLIAPGGGGDPEPPPFYPTYVIDTATGVTSLPEFSLLTEFGLDGPYWAPRPGAVWLEGNDRVLTEERGTLYEADLRTLTRTAVGAVQAQDWAWFPLPR